MPAVSYESRTNEELMQASKSDIQAFGALIERYQKPIIRYIRRISGMPENEAEEVAQEVFLRVWKNLNGFDAKLKFTTWLYRIAHNETINTWQKSVVRGAENRQDWDEEVFGEFPSKTDITAEIDRTMDAREVKKILLMMPEKYRHVLILRFLEELDYNEISDVLRVPPGTVATLLHRAKESFRQLATRNGFPVSPVYT